MRDLIFVLLILFAVSAYSQNGLKNPVATASGSDLPTIEPGVSQELAKWRAAHYSDIRYKLNLTLEKMSPVLKGTIEIRVSVSSPHVSKGSTPGSQAETRAVASVLPIILDWRKIKGHEDKSTISNVSMNGKPLILGKSDAFTRSNAGTAEAITLTEENEHLIFRDGVVPGENVIKLDFTSPILTSGSAITRYVDKEDGAEYIYSLFVPSDASTAFPVFDQPDLKARFKLFVKAPIEWQVVSNSAEDVVVHQANTSGWMDENASTGFKITKPISTYVFAFAAGPWERVSVPPAVAGGLTEATSQGSNIGSNPNAQPPATAGGTDRTVPSTAIYVRRSQAVKFKPHATEVFRLNRKAVKYFEEYFDYKFPFPKYDLVLIPEFPFGGMEHAGAIFLRESAIIFPQEPTRNDHISRALLIFHEASHQWFGDTVTMRWFDDLWLKEGFATFTAYKAMEKIMPEMNAWKVFYERVKQAAYQTDSTKGTTAIYQPIANLSAAKSAYGNIVYNKAPAFLRQAEFYLGEDKFQTAVRAFLKKHEFGNAGWEDLVTEFEVANGKKILASSSVSEREKVEIKKYNESKGTDLTGWAELWVKSRGLPKMFVHFEDRFTQIGVKSTAYELRQMRSLESNLYWQQRTRLFIVPNRKATKIEDFMFGDGAVGGADNYLFKTFLLVRPPQTNPQVKLTQPDSSADFEPHQLGSHFLTSSTYPAFIFPNYGDYGYGIFLLDEKSRDYVLKNIQNEKDPFLRTMMWGALWDSVREGEIDPRVFVELVVKVLQKPDREGGRNARRPDNALTDVRASAIDDESTVALLLNRVGTAMNYYLSEPPASAGGQPRNATNRPAAHAAGSDLRTRVEDMLIERMRNAETLGQKITFYRAFLNIALSQNARTLLKAMLKQLIPPAVAGGLAKSASTTGSAAQSQPPATAGGTDRTATSIPLKTKDRFDIVTRLLILNDPDAPKLLTELEKTETSDDAKRYAYAAKAGSATAENKAKYWNDFVNNKEISESWIEAALGPFNSIRHSEQTLGYLQKALQELPNHKRSRKIFFVNGWLGAFIGGQRSEEALGIVNKFLADNPNLDNDLRLKILENVDLIERAVKIRSKWAR